MTVLLDTHTVLWFWWDDPRLSVAAKNLICDPANRKWVSMASAWEVAIKISRKKLDIGGAFAGFFDLHMMQSYFEWLPITTKHLNHIVDLPFHHADPFDRLLIAQAISEGVSIVSADAQLDLYGIARVW